MSVVFDKPVSEKSRKLAAGYMKVGIFGLGYVGTTSACCIASQGNSVLGFDINPEKVAQINSAIPPVREPGLDDLLKQARAESRIEATVSVDARINDLDVILVCVGTPSTADGSHDMSAIVHVTSQIAAAIDAKRKRKTPLTIAYRSTFRPGSMDKLVAPVFRATLGDDFARKVELVYNPEFLREASAIDDYFNPPKIVIGTADAKPSVNMEKLHAGIAAPVFHTGYREAEITKFVDNTWHAVKVAYANEIGRICQKLGISASKVHEIFVSDRKLNISPAYTRPGGAFGGSCLPKDVRALQHMSTDIGANTHLIDTLLRSNESHKLFQYEEATQGLAAGARVLLVGLAFKAETDDLRESPNLDIARRLLDAGYKLDIYDPGLDPARLVGCNLGYAYSYLPSLDALLIDKRAAESRTYDLVIATNATFKGLNVSASRTIDIGAIK